MADLTIPLNLRVQGQIYATGGLRGGAATLRNADIATDADIDASKQEHQYSLTIPLTNHGATPAALRQTIHAAYGAAGTVVAASVGVVTAVASGSFTIDIYKNGSSILSSTLTINSSNGTAYAVNDCTINTAAYDVDDIFEVVQTISTPSGGGGAWLLLTLREDAA